MSLDLQNSNCLQCEGQNPYLQKSRSYQCVSQCDNDYSLETQTFSCDLKKYQPKNCIFPQSQYYNQECVCPDGMYKDNNLCKDCPDYCVTCSSSIKCIEYYGIPRNQNGKCEIGEYDDGKSCISDFIIIPNTQNAQLIFQTQNIGCNTQPTIINKDNFSFQDASLFIGIQSNSFFLTFNFNLNVSPPYDQNNYYTLFYLTNEGYHLFTFAAKAISIDEMRFILIQQFMGSQVDIISGHLDTNTDVQIGFYTDLSDVSLIVQYSNSPQSFYKSKFKKMYPILSKPQLVFASASPIFSSSPYSSQFCGKIGSHNVLFKVVKISSMKYPSGLEIVKFDVVLNYRTDQQEFIFPLSQYISSNLVIQLGSQKVNQINAYFFFSDLQIYQGGHYYINYDNDNPCFIYIDKSDMKCIIPKQGYVIKNNQAIPNQNCNQGEDSNSPILFYNPYTLKCQNSNVIIPFCKEISFSNFNQCTKCSDQIYMDVSNNCECIQGMYLDKVTQKCKCKLLLFIEQQKILINLFFNNKVCSKVCKSCSIHETYCNECMEQSLNPPSCNCLLSNQFRNSQYLCQNCDIQCDRCLGNSSTCISCSYGRINPPICYCESDANTYSTIDSISKACENIQCQNKCQSCSQKPGNCIQCRGDRVNPPICNCPKGRYEDPVNLNNQFCLKCPNNFYYDLLLHKCIQCNRFCDTCYGPDINNCLSCQSIYQLNSQNQCYCKEGNSPVLDLNNSTQCFKNMDVTQNIYIKNNQYFILIQFEYAVDNLESIIKKLGINLVFSFSIGQISPNYYSIVSYSFPKNNQIILNIEIKTNIQRTFGQLIFLKSNIFQNFKNQAVLNPIYLIKPFQFEIGPYFTETKLQIDIKLSSTLSQQSIGFFRNIQFLFYLINSAQPTVMLLLVDIQIPPNFYKFLSEIGQLVFRNVSEYSQINFQNFYFFGGQNITSYVKPTQIYQFDRVGFCNSYLANAEFIFYKYLICLFLFIFLNIISQYILNKRYSQTIKKFFMGRILAETEINFLMNFLSIMIQFSNIDQENYVSRQSLYASIFLLIIIIYFWFYYYKEYNSNRLNQGQDFFNILDGKLDKNKIKSSWSVKNFYFVCLFKKIILILVIFCFYQNSISICYIFAIINLISGIYTLSLRPHDFLFRNMLKGLADIILSVVWIYMILFNELFKNLQGNIVMNDHQVDSIMVNGFIASLMALTYNLIFLFIFIIEIVKLISNLIKKKKRTNLIIGKKGTQKLENKTVLIGNRFQKTQFKNKQKIIDENNKI